MTVPARINGRTATVKEVMEAMDEHGYCILEKFMPDGWAESVKKELRENVLGTNPSGRNDFEGFDTRRIYALYAKTRSFDQAAINPLILSVMDQLLGGHYHLSSVVGIDIGPGEKAQILHRDTDKYPLPHGFPEVVVNTMWAIDDFTDVNGATCVFPKTHSKAKGPQPRAYARTEACAAPTPAPKAYLTTPAAIEEAQADPKVILKATMPAGSVMIYRGSLVHGGGQNASENHRLGVILEYAAGWLRQQENHCLAVPKAIASKLPERLQELLGYNIYPPFVGYVDGRHPRRALL